jgi:thymidylate synthase (FAD)
MPIFVARQWIRHRTANVNEYSARYSVMPDKFYRPERQDIKTQSTSNRQGTSTDISDDMTADQFLSYLDTVEGQYAEYKALLEKGLSREQARIGLPVNIYTEWYWKCDLHNIYRFLSLRMDLHAQKEIRDYANAMYRLVAEICPIATEAFVDYQLEGMFLTRLEIEAIQNQKAKLNVNNVRENQEWTEKMNKLGLKYE